jgi:TolB-like protein/AraC-like DNA-binding protein
MNKELIKRLTELVEENLANEAFGIKDLAREIGMSHSNLHRKLKSISNQNASQFIREIRLKKAKELLLSEDLTAAEVSFLVGFGSPTYFNKCFHEYFGVTPGELRTPEPDKEPEEQFVEPKPKNNKRAKILISLLISLMVLIPTTIILIHNVSISKAEILPEKSIALLPFKYMSDESGKQYLADGIMDAILLQLSKIKDLRVVSRTSVEQYRKTDKTSKTIGQELDVEYVLEGSLQKEGDKVRLIVQLIKTSDDSHMWSNEYNRQWKNIFSVQTEVSETVASELHAVIAPEERQLIRKEPTNNLTAYDFYQRGKNELEKYEFRINRDSMTLKKSQRLFQKALELDSTFALAYTGLAAIQFWSSENTYLSENYLDSVLILANKALTCDPQCSEAYYYRAQVYSQTSKTAEALNEIDIAIKFNPNDWKAYFLRSIIFGNLNDNIDAISNLYEVVLRNRGSGLPHFLTRFSLELSNIGFTDLGKKYEQQALELDGDSIRYLHCLAWAEYCDENFENAYRIAKNAYERDSIRDNNLADYCYITGRYKEAYSLCLNLSERMNKSGIIEPGVLNIIAYCLWQNGRTKEAEIYFKQKNNFDLKCIKLERLVASGKWSQFGLAEMNTLHGNIEKAYYYLDEVNKNQSFSMDWVIYFKYSPFFNTIRHEPRFQQILRDVETKYQAEHERVRKWLKEKRIQ